MQKAQERHQPSLVRYARGLLGGDAVRARTVVDEALAELGTMPPGEVDDELEEWLFGQTRRRILGSGGLDSQRQAADRDDDSAGTGDWADGESEAQTMQRILAGLTPKQLEALRLKFHFGFNYQKISRITELSSFNVTQLMHHAVAHVGRDFASARDRTKEPPRLDDARLTAYALNELEPRERQAFETNQLNLKSAGERITLIRSLGTQITQALARDSGAAATVQRRRRLVPLWLRRPTFWLALGVVAAVGYGVFYWLKHRPAEAPAAAPREVIRLKAANWKTPGAESEETQNVSAGESASPASGGGSKPSGSRAHAGGRQKPADVAETESQGPAEPDSASVPSDERESSGSAGAAGSRPEKASGIETGRIVGAPAAKARGENGALTSIAPSAQAGAAAGAVVKPDEKPAPTPESDFALKLDAKPKPAKPDALKTAAPSLPKKAAEIPKPGLTEPREKFQAAETSPKAELPLRPDARPVLALKRSLAHGTWPKPSQVRVDALLNYFPPTPLTPKGPAKFGASVEAAPAPWASTHRIVRVAVQGKAQPVPSRLPATVVFLVDVSGSMDAPNRLPLVQEALRTVLSRLRPDDRVGIVSYAGESRLTLAPVPVADGRVIREALGRLQAGGETNGGVGLELAYELVRAQAQPAAVNAIILCTDGGFNSGATSEDALRAIVDRYADTPVTLGVFGFGRGKRIDGRLEALAIRGRGHSGYVDTRSDAERVLTEQVNGLLAPLARDVRVEVAFNPKQVRAYRRLGDEATEVPAAEPAPDPEGRTLLPGQAVTALYEIEPVETNPAEVDPAQVEPGLSVSLSLSNGRTGLSADLPSRGTGASDRIFAGAQTNPSGGRVPPSGAHAAAPEPLLTLSVAYTLPEGGVKHTEAFPLADTRAPLAKASDDFKFAVAVAAFARALQAGPKDGKAALDQVEAWGKECLGDDAGGYRSEFLRLVAEARMAE